jgi:hypothetical protein
MTTRDRSYAPLYYQGWRDRRHEVWTVHSIASASPAATHVAAAPSRVTR